MCSQARGRSWPLEQTSFKPIKIIIQEFLTMSKLGKHARSWSGGQDFGNNTPLWQNTCLLLRLGMEYHPWTPLTPTQVTASRLACQPDGCLWLTLQPSGVVIRSSVEKLDAICCVFTQFCSIYRRLVLFNKLSPWKHK